MISFMVLGAIALGVAASSGSSSIILSACIAIFASLTAPALLLYFTNRQHIKDKEMDYKRQDEVAKRVEAATLSAQKAAQSSHEAAQSASDKLDQVQVTSDVIHTLVNSDKTAAMQRELDATKRELVMLREINRLHEQAGASPAPEALATIDFTERRISELTEELEERHQQDQIANKIDNA